MTQASLLVLRTQSSRSDKRCKGADNDTKTRLYRSVIFLIRWNKLPKAKEALGRECNLHISRNPASLGNHERLDWAESWFCHWCQEGSSHGWKEKLWLNGGKKEGPLRRRAVNSGQAPGPRGKRRQDPWNPAAMLRTREGQNVAVWRPATGIQPRRRIRSQSELGLTPPWDPKRRGEGQWAFLSQEKSGQRRLDWFGWRMLLVGPEINNFIFFILGHPWCKI